VSTEDSIKYDIHLGRIVGCHGLKGTMKVRTRFNDPDLLLNADKVLIVAKDKGDKIASISDFSLNGDTFLLTVSECSSRTDAEALVTRTSMSLKVSSQACLRIIGG
jgi:ribosomal 30S subunit maturation factor RimM